MVAAKSDSVITILLVENVAEIRANVGKLLSFESDFEVVGMASSGHEGLALAKALRPDIVIMDINMPNGDGLQVTSQIINSLPNTGIILLSAHEDQNAIRLAMIAGAKAVLAQPSSADELYHTVRAVYTRAHAQLQSGPRLAVDSVPAPGDNARRAGNIIVVYSPQGGAGCTTIATNLASALTQANVQVLLVDANLQFGDVGVFLNLEPRITLVDLVKDVEGLDTEYLENVVTTHSSGLKVLMGPTRPELAEPILSDPTSVTRIVNKIRYHYDFILVDTSLHLDDLTLSLLDTATRILLVSTPTLASLKNVRFVLDLFDQVGYAPMKTLLVINQVSANQMARKLAISAEKAGAFLKRPVEAVIPSDEFLLLDAVRKGVPAVALGRDRHKSPLKELFDLAQSLLAGVMPAPQPAASSQNGQISQAKIVSRKRVVHHES